MSRKHVGHPSLDLPAILGNEYDWCDSKSVPNLFFYILDIYFHVFSCIFNIGEYIWTAIMGNSNDFDVF